MGGAAVPTLEEVLWLLSGTGVGLQLELKAPGRYPGVVADLAAVVGTVPGVEVVVQSFDFAAMKELKARRPEQRVGLLGAPPPGHFPTLASWADQLNPHHWAANARLVDAVHAVGMQCIVWTVDRPNAMRRVLRSSSRSTTRWTVLLTPLTWGKKDSVTIATRMPPCLASPVNEERPQAGCRVKCGRALTQRRGAPADTH